MNGILIFILSYIGFLIVWYVVVLIFYFLSYIFKKNLASIPYGLIYIISILIQLYLFGYALYFLWQLIRGHEWLLLVLALIFGGFVMNWWQVIYSLLLAPFSWIAETFLNKFSATDLNEDVLAGEILDKDNKVIDVTEGETSIKKRFAKYFIGFYVFNLVYMLISPAEREGLAVFDFITKPFFQIIGSTIIVGVPYGIIRLLRHKPFLTKDKRYFLIQTWKICLYIFIPLSVIVLGLAILTNTL